MSYKHLLLLLSTFFFFSACSRVIDDGKIFHYDTSLSYDESILILDSISDCIVSREETDFIVQMRSILIERQGDKETLAFLTQIYCSRDNFKSIGVHEDGNVLYVALIEKEKTPGTPLDCPVYVYSTVKKDIRGKYISSYGYSLLVE